MASSKAPYEFLLRNKNMLLYILLQHKRSKSTEHLASRVGLSISHAQQLIKVFEMNQLITIKKPHKILQADYTPKGEMVRERLLTLTKVLQE
jgi:predicted transcriptional regulator